jgi:hypothetical protein
MLRELGWDARRFRLVLRLSDWDSLDRIATARDSDWQNEVGVLMHFTLLNELVAERVSLTPAGEAALADPIELGSRVVKE